MRNCQRNNGKSKGKSQKLKAKSRKRSRKFTEYGVSDYKFKMVQNRLSEPPEIGLFHKYKIISKQVATPATPGPAALFYWDNSLGRRGTRCYPTCYPCRKTTEYRVQSTEHRNKPRSQRAKDWLKGEALLERQSSASPLRAGAAMEMGISTPGA